MEPEPGARGSAGGDGPGGHSSMGCLQHPRLQWELGEPVVQMKGKRGADNFCWGTKRSYPVQGASSVVEIRSVRDRGDVGVGRSRGVYVRIGTEAPPDLPCGRREKPGVYGVLCWSGFYVAWV